MVEAIHGDLQKAARISIGLSILMILAGLLAIFLPQMAGLAVDVLVGWLLMFSGGLHLIVAWQRSGAGGVVWEILLSLIYGCVGAYLLVQPVSGLVTLTLAVSWYLLLKGLIESLFWFERRHSHGSGWLLFDGVVTIVLAAMIWTTWPSSSWWVIGTLAGISMFLSGLTRLMLSMAMRRAFA